jgi:hypothetical protein
MHSARSGKINTEASAAALAAAAAGDALTRVHVTPLGEMPGPALAGFTALDILVHGWVAGTTIAGRYDAAGQLFSELTAAAIDFGDVRLSQGRRSSMILIWATRAGGFEPSWRFPPGKVPESYSRGKSRCVQAAYERTTPPRHWGR